MTIYLRTRGRTTDYFFLGEVNPENWWSKFEQRTSIERPTIIIERDKTSLLRGYFGGIESPSRRDRVNTVIRYTVVVEDDPNVIIALTRAYLCPPCAPHSRGIGKLLDEAVGSEEEIEALFRSQDGNRTNDILTKVTQSLNDAFLPAVNNTGESDRLDTHWFACVAMEEACLAFIARVEQLAKPTFYGLAAMLNLMGTEVEARVLGAEFQSMALLVEPVNESSGNCIVALNVSKQMEPLPKQSGLADRSNWPDRLRRNKFTAVFGVGLMALVVWVVAAHMLFAPTASSSSTEVPVR